MAGVYLNSVYSPYDAEDTLLTKYFIKKKKNRRNFKSNFQKFFRGNI